MSGNVSSPYVLKVSLDSVGEKPPNLTEQENSMHLLATILFLLLFPVQQPQTERVICTVMNFTPDGYVGLQCKDAVIQYQCGHWPEEWKDGPVFQGTYKADLVRIPLSERLIDGVLEEGQSLQIDGKLMPVTSRSPEVKVPVEILETVREQQWRCGGPLIPLQKPEVKNAN